MTRYERPPRGLEFKASALATPAAVPAPQRRGREIHTAIIGPIGVARGGDLIERGAMTASMARRTPKVALNNDWNRGVGKVIGGSELPAGDPRIPSHTPDGLPWPADGGALMLRVELMPSVTADSALAVKAVRAAGRRCRWSFGFKATDVVHSRGVRRIRALELYSLSPHVDGVGVGEVKRVPGGPVLEVKDALPSLRWGTRPHVLMCAVCDTAVGLADRPLPTSARLICQHCRDHAGRLMDPFTLNPDPGEDTGEAVDVEDQGEPDRITSEDAFDEAMREEQEWAAQADGTLRPGGGGRRPWQP